MKYLVHWVNEDKWDVYDEEEALKRIPQVLRFEGALGLMSWKDGDEYLGKLRKIGDKKTVEREEALLRTEIEKAKSEVPTKRSKKKTVTCGKASDRLVSAALGEKPKLTPEQAEARKLSMLNRKMKLAAEKEEEEKQDLALRSNVARNLNFDKINKTVDSNVLSDDDLVDVDDENDDDEEMLESTIARTNENAGSDESDSDEDEHHKEEIEEYKNPVIVGFLHFLLKKFGSPAPISTGDDQQLFAQPLIVEGQKMVRLVKGHSLRINKGGRNVLVIDTKSKKCPSVFLRKALAQLYGSNLNHITAMGRKKGTVTISDADKSAIYDFVVEQCGPNARAFTWQKFIRSMTKKCSAAKSPKAKKGNTAKASKDTGSETKAGNSHATREEQNRNTPIAVQVTASPVKFQKTLLVEKISSQDGPETSQHSVCSSAHGSGLSQSLQSLQNNHKGFHGGHSGAGFTPQGQPSQFQGQQPSQFQGQPAQFQGQQPSQFQGQPAQFQGKPAQFQQGQPAQFQEQPAQFQAYHGAGATGFTSGYHGHTVGAEFTPQGQSAGYQGPTYSQSHDQWSSWYNWQNQQAQQGHPTLTH